MSEQDPRFDYDPLDSQDSSRSPDSPASEDEASLRSRLEGFVPETVKKLALAGVGALFLTEEGIRNVVSEMKLPREAVGTVLAQTERARSELFRMIALEFRTFLDHANVSGELSKALQGVEIDVHATVAFRQAKDGGLGPKMKVKVTRKDPPASGTSPEGAAQSREDSQGTVAKDNKEPASEGQAQASPSDDPGAPTSA